MKTSWGLLLGAALMGLVVLSSLSETRAAEPELRPSQVAMRARAGWLKAMGENLAAKNFEAVKADAKALSDQTGAAAQKLDNPLAKELTLKVSTLAAAAADGAGMGKEAAVAAALADIKSACGECHAKIRDKK